MCALAACPQVRWDTGKGFYVPELACKECATLEEALQVGRSFTTQGTVKHKRLGGGRTPAMPPARRWRLSFTGAIVICHFLCFRCAPVLLRRCCRWRCGTAV
jgi:hypothetical protein